MIKKLTFFLIFGMIFGFVGCKKNQTIIVQNDFDEQPTIPIQIKEFERFSPNNISDINFVINENSLKITWKDPFEDSFFNNPINSIIFSYKTNKSAIFEQVEIQKGIQELIIENIDKNAEFYDFFITTIDEQKKENKKSARFYLDNSKCPKIGDIILNDKTIIHYDENIEFSQTEKINAVSIIAGFINGIPLGIGLKQSKSSLIWAKWNSTGNNTNFNEIICTPVSQSDYSPSFKYWDESKTWIGDTDGSDNWEQICKIDTEQNNLLNYPAFDFAINYKNITNLSGELENGWYLPSIMELFIIYQNKDTLNKILKKLDAPIFEENYYWSSSQYYETYNNSLTVNFFDGYISHYIKYYDNFVCVVRQF